MSVDFEEALGRCDVRTNTVVPVLCLRLGTPRRCCTSRILSCTDRLVHALRLVVSCATSLSLSVSYQQRRLRVALGGETLFETVCPSLFPSLLHNRVLWKEIYQVRGYGFGAQFFFFFFFFERSIFDSLVEREREK